MPKGERKSNREVKKPKKAGAAKTVAPPPRSMSSVIRVASKPKK